MSLRKNKTVLMILLAVFFICLLVLILGIHPFLAKDRPVDADVLIFEGWIIDLDDSIDEAIQEFNNGNYRYLIVAGSDLLISEKNENYRTYTEFVKAQFSKHGFDTSKLFTVNVPSVQKNMNFTIALSTKIWMVQSGIETEAINVFTFGVHARKSEVVFKQVFEPEIMVGVVSAEPAHYNPKYWWMKIIGIKWVYYDALKYIRAII